MQRNNNVTPLGAIKENSLLRLIVLTSGPQNLHISEGNTPDKKFKATTACLLQAWKDKISVINWRC